MTDKSDWSPGEPPVRRGEIAVAKLIRMFFRHKKFIIAWTFIVALSGAVYAMLAAPIYNSAATIALRESEKNSDASRLLSQIGGVGGMAVSQLGLGGHSMDRVEIVMNGYELSEALVVKHDLLPVLYPKLWDKKKKAWKVKKASQTPTVRGGADLFRKKLLGVSLDAKKRVFRVSVNTYDSTLAKRLVDLYLTELNTRLRDEVIDDAETNREYLERQLAATLDPLLKEKIIGMIGFELERGMLVDSHTFAVLERALVPVKRSSPRRFRILALAIIMGLVSSAFLVFTWTWFSGMRENAAHLKSSHPQLG